MVVTAAEMALARERLVAMTAQLRHGLFAGPEVFVDDLDRRWIRLSTLLRSKRRFHELNPEAVEALLESDTGRFQLYRDDAAVVWVRAIPR